MPDAYNMSPVWMPVIPVVDVTMMLPSSDDIRLSSDVIDGEGLHSGTPYAFTDMSPFVKFVVIPFVFVMITF